MTDQNETEDAREADDMGEKPDLGRRADALTDALSGSDMGSDTRSGSLQGGSASGSEIDPDQTAINQSLASKGRASASTPSSPVADAETVKNTGDAATDDGGDEAEAPTG